MKVIAGKYRWKKIHTSKKGFKTDFKPTKAVVREAVFNIINHYELLGEFNMEGANFMDAFCGSGAYGIEALSRGASSVHFVNKSREHLELAKYNVSMLNGCNQENIQYLLADATKLTELPYVFDLIFIDPPYRTNLWKGCLDSISNNIELSKQNLIIVELSTRQDFDTPDEFHCLTQKTYGNTKIYVLRTSKL